MLWRQPSPYAVGVACRGWRRSWPQQAKVRHALAAQAVPGVERMSYMDCSRCRHDRHRSLRAALRHWQCHSLPPAHAGDVKQCLPCAAHGNRPRRPLGLWQYRCCVWAHPLLQRGPRRPAPLRMPCSTWRAEEYQYRAAQHRVSPLCFLLPGPLNAGVRRPSALPFSSACARHPPGCWPGLTH